MQLPYWDIYIKEKKDKHIIVGGKLAGNDMKGLSGGQRKILLFELISQRTVTQENLLIVLDEPFAGVTDDFVPFIVERLNKMREKHNILLVTNDHVETLKNMADNAVTVSAIDRSKVKINGRERIDRDLAILAMSIGDGYKNTTNDNDLMFFGRVEFSMHGGIPSVALYAVVMYGLFLLTFWGSKSGSEDLILVAGELVSFYTAYPYVLQLVDWRVYMAEEAEALMHSSKSTNKLLKAIMTLFILFIIACIQFSCMFAVIGTLADFEFFIAILFDNVSQLISLICLGLYSDLPDQTVQTLGQVPFLLMVFFSTTFSPGAGVNGIKEFRYLFPRFYLWCMLPDENEMEMEGCPENNTLVYLIVSSLLFPLLFALWKLGQALYARLRQKKTNSSLLESMRSLEFAELQLELYGKKALHRLAHLGSTHDLEQLASTYHSKNDVERIQTAAHCSSDEEDEGDDDSFVSSLMELNPLVNRQVLEDLVSKYRAANQVKVGSFLDGANQDRHSNGTVSEHFCNNGNNGPVRF